MPLSFVETLAVSQNNHTRQANFVGYGSGANLRGSFISEFTGVFLAEATAAVPRAVNAAGGSRRSSPSDLAGSGSEGSEGGEGKAALGAEPSVRADAAQQQQGAAYSSNSRGRGNGEPESLTSKRRQENGLAEAAGGDGGDGSGRASRSANRYPDGPGVGGARAGQKEKAPAWKQWQIKHKQSQFKL